MEHVLIVFHCLLGLIFVVSAAGKLRTGASFDAFVKGLHDVQLQCFGASEGPFGRRHVVRNLVLLVVAVAVVFVLVDGGSKVVPVVEKVLAVAFAGVVATLVISFDEITDLIVGPQRGAIR